MPFNCDLAKEWLIIDSLTEAVENVTPFEIQCQGFDAFQTKTIFVKLKESSALFELQKKVSQIIRRRLLVIPKNNSRPFHPHITVAFRDLRKPAFVRSWNEFKTKSFERKMPVKGIWLLKHDGKRWKRFHEIPFKTE